MSYKEILSGASPAMELHSRTAAARGRTCHGEATTELREAVEHEPGVLRNPVRLGLADGQHERHLRVSGRQTGPDSPLVAGSTADGVDRATHHRQHERSYLGQAGAAAAL